MDAVQLVKDKIRNIKDFPIEGIIFRDITTAVKDKDAFREIINFLTDKFIDLMAFYVGCLYVYMCRQGLTRRLRRQLFD